jgi:uncharacterized damage-inducible protein DinB
MSFTDAFLAEYDHEMSTTRRVLARVPAANSEWKPHEKSMPMRQLAHHVANLPLMAKAILTTTVFDAVVDREPPPAFEKTADLVAAFDVRVKELRELIVGKTDGELLSVWTLKSGGKELFTLPKAVALRSLFLNHSIHHRGQLSVYLRLNDVPVPSMYGPSADEARP